VVIVVSPPGVVIFSSLSDDFFSAHPIKPMADRQRIETVTTRRFIIFVSFLKKNSVREARFTTKQASLRQNTGAKFSAAMRRGAVRCGL
jgi:hypothetical protein